MKLLLDGYVWGGARGELAAAGHDVIWAGEWEQDPGDNEILACAHAEGRILVTIDRDFGELASVRRMPHSGIVRLVDHPARQQAAACLSALARYADELRCGAIVTVERGRLRFRPPEGEGA